MNSYWILLREILLDITSWSLLKYQLSDFVRSMHFKQLEEVYVFLTELFDSKYPLPKKALLNDVITRAVMVTNYTLGVQAFMYLVENIEENYNEIIEASNSSVANEPELNLFDSKAPCISFLNIIVNEDYLLNEDDCQQILQKIFYIVSHTNVLRVLEVIQLLREVNYICLTIQPTQIYIPTFDERSCVCFEYEMSGDCPHTNDDEVLLGVC